MAITAKPNVQCPLCGSRGTRHPNIRASLLYSCWECSHEWKIDPSQEPLQPNPAVTDRPRTPSPAQPPHKR